MQRTLSSDKDTTMKEKPDVALLDQMMMMYIIFYYIIIDHHRRGFFYYDIGGIFVLVDACPVALNQQGQQEV